MSEIFDNLANALGFFKKHSVPFEEGATIVNGFKLGTPECDAEIERIVGNIDKEQSE